MSQELLVRLQAAAVYQQEKPVLENLFIDIHPGEFVYLIGATGSGKSSFLRMLYADLPLAEGTGHVADFSLHALKRAEIPFLRRQLGIIFQEFELLTDRSVADNLRFVLQATGWSSKTAMNTRIDEVLAHVQLSEKRDFFPLQLSGGEQQRVAIARALLNKPRLILADEPTGNLDPGVASEILQLFVTIHEQEQTAVVMATHHHHFIKKFPARVLRCQDQTLRSISKDRVLQSLGL